MRALVSGFPLVFLFRFCHGHHLQDMMGNVAYVRDKATNKVLADRASKPKRRHRRTRGV